VHDERRDGTGAEAGDRMVLASAQHRQSKPAATYNRGLAEERGLGRGVDELGVDMVASVGGGGGGGARRCSAPAGSDEEWKEDG
jgi:hypothetical protein